MVPLFLCQLCSTKSYQDDTQNQYDQYRIFRPLLPSCPLLSRHQCFSLSATEDQLVHQPNDLLKEAPSTNQGSLSASLLDFSIHSFSKIEHVSHYPLHIRNQK